jgi:hypothetical protein
LISSGNRFRVTDEFEVYGLSWVMGIGWTVVLIWSATALGTGVYRAPLS